MVVNMQADKLDTHLEHMYNGGGKPKCIISRWSQSSIDRLKANGGFKQLSKQITDLEKYIDTTMYFSCEWSGDLKVFSFAFSGIDKTDKENEKIKSALGKILQCYTNGDYKDIKSMKPKDIIEQDNPLIGGCFLGGGDNCQCPLF